ncbi:aminoacyl-tRNA hydrolase [Candidatus Peregrinibacteria bacterium]|nr:aminoacyl-tRNA hydrolase [Candidatus Peregrinibacteria bacterium]MBI3816825.1 aminoacyl-tRNA hydrolase [Candidatus Peregrinibacteria bacterium]
MKPSLLIIGLGNPGAAYEKTRHNVGFQALDRLSESFGQSTWQDKQKFLSLVQEARIVTAPVLLVKPQTYMNRSGEAIKKLVEFYKLDPSEQLLVLCDDVDLPLGETRLRKSGGPGTHNGLKSIALPFGERFPRLRIGLGPQPAGADLSAWVLSVPTQEEYQELERSFAKLPEIVRSFVLGTSGGV